MSDIFSRSGQDFKGAFAVDGAALTFAGAGNDNLTGGVGLLTQNLSVQYAQSVTKLYELGTQNVYLVAGRTQGNIGMGRVLGPRPIQVAFYQTYGDVCRAAQNTLNLEAKTGCGNSPDGRAGGAVYRFRLLNCVITQIGVTIAAADMIINEQLAMMFISLNLT